MRREVWTSLANEDQAIWDQLSQAAKKTILDHQAERQEQSANAGVQVNVASSDEPNRGT